METNSLLTNKIQLSGGGLHKSYEESIIVVSKNINFGLSYHNQIFYNINTGGIVWADRGNDEDYDRLLNDTETYKKVTLLKVLPFNGDQAFIEVIDPNILHMHLVQEAEQQRLILEKLDENQIKLTL